MEHAQKFSVGGFYNICTTVPKILPTFFYVIISWYHNTRYQLLLAAVLIYKIHKLEQSFTKSYPDNMGTLRQEPMGGTSDQ
jgi:hypothetical protein